MKLPSISTMSSIVLGVMISIVATFSFIVDAIGSINYGQIRFIPLTLDIFIIILAYSTTWQGIYHIMYEKFTRAKMEHEWDFKVKPVVKLVQDTAGHIEKMERDLMSIQLEVAHTNQHFIDNRQIEPSHTFIYPGTSFMLVAKIMMLVVVTSASLVYVSEYPLGMIHYFITGLFILWWLLFTSEYKLFSKTVSWVWAIIPVLIVPSMGIILDVTLGLNNMIAILFSSLLVYAFSYYWFTCYMGTGYNMLNLRPILKFLLVENKK